MFCLTKVRVGFSVSRCPPETAEQLVPQPRKFVPLRLSARSPSFVCRSQCSDVGPAGWDVMGTTSLPDGDDVVEVLGLPILALIAEKTFTSCSRKQIALHAGAKTKLVAFAGQEENASRFVGEDAGTHIKPAG